MKHLLFISVLAVTFSMTAQIPVTDVATQGSLAGINLNISQTNMKIGNTNRKLEQTNKKLQKLIDLLKDNNDIADNNRDIANEELEAKKTAPGYVLNSNEVQRAMQLKDKIIEVFNAARNAVENMEMLTSTEKSNFLTFLANEISEAQKYFRQSREIINTQDIILPEERLKKVDDVNGYLEVILENINTYNRKITSKNYNRLTRQSIIDLTKEE